jgi:hypothetical protein
VVARVLGTGFQSHGPRELPVVRAMYGMPVPPTHLRRSYLGVYSGIVAFILLTYCWCSGLFSFARYAWLPVGA